MRVIARATFGLLWLAMLVVGPADAAGALSCAEHPNATPEAIASGTEVLSSTDRFFDRYDFAVLGTVIAIDTIGVGQPRYGATTISIAPIAVLGPTALTETMTLSSPDPGWVVGYGFVEGNSYFVPVRAIGPQGEANFSSVCDPITEIADVRSTAADLERAAAEGGDVQFASVVASSGPSTSVPAPYAGSAGGGTTASNDGRGLVFGAIAAGIFIIVVGMFVVWASRSRVS